MSKIILICYHKNLYGLYLRAWIEQFRDSILNQTYKDFQIYEINYGGGKVKIFENSIFESKDLPTFIHAMNYLIEKALNNGADIVANCNVDDFYSPHWLRIQLPYIKNNQYDICSCNFSLIKDNAKYHEHYFDKLDIKEELEKNHNIICHPAVIYSRKFLEENKYVPEDFPFEDMMLWQRTIDNYKFKIVPENLLYHRLHENSVCKSENR